MENWKRSESVQGVKYSQEVGAEKDGKVFFGMTNKKVTGDLSEKALKQQTLG